MQRLTEAVVKAECGETQDQKAGESVPPGFEDLPGQLPGYNQLVTLIQEQTAPPSQWAEEDGDGGTVSVHDNTLFIQQT